MCPCTSKACHDGLFTTHPAGCLVLTVRTDRRREPNKRRLQHTSELPAHINGVRRLPRATQQEYITSRTEPVRECIDACGFVEGAGSVGERSGNINRNREVCRYSRVKVRTVGRML
ncbi:unnamed protein product [Boreogadus saida]